MDVIALLFERFEPLLKKLARRYSKYGDLIDSYDDLYQTIAYLFMYSLKIYDPRRGKLSSHIKATITRKLNSMIFSREPAPLSSSAPFYAGGDGLVYSDSLESFWD